MFTKGARIFYYERHDEDNNNDNNNDDDEKDVSFFARFWVVSVGSVVTYLFPLGVSRINGRNRDFSTFFSFFFFRLLTKIFFIHEVLSSVIFSRESESERAYESDVDCGFALNFIITLG